MDYYGCEFLDFETPRFTALEKGSKENQDQIVMIPIDLLNQISDKQEQSEKERANAEKIQALMLSISEHGILYPGTIFYNERTIRFQDGNHRHIAARRLGLKEFPVVFRYTDGNIRAKGCAFSSVFEKIIQDAYAR